MNNIDLKISSIKDVAFYINAPNVISPNDIGVKVEGKKMNIDAESKNVSFLTEVTYVRNYNAEEVEILLNYINLTSFDVENFEEIFKPKDGYYTFDSGVAKFLLDIIIPTIRGILYTKTAGTGLNSCYLPLIPSDKIVQSA